MPTGDRDSARHVVLRDQSCNCLFVRLDCIIFRIFLNENAKELRFIIQSCVLGVSCSCKIGHG